jgi:hypothetical protein
MTLKDYSADTINHLLENFFELVEEGEVEGPESWYSLKYGEDVPCDVAGLGRLNLIESYGGEGKGDEYWVVFSLSEGDVTRYFRKDGWYQSYSGGELDGELTEVTPVPKVVTVWE